MTFVEKYRTVLLSYNRDYLFCDKNASKRSCTALQNNVFKDKF